MKESEIAEKLGNAGFVLQPKRGIAIDAGRPTLRYSREGIRGSFYATENYLSATGPYARLRDKTPPTREDRKGYPVWQGDQLAAVLTAVLATYADVDRQPTDPTETESKPGTESEIPAVAEVAGAVAPTTTAPTGTASTPVAESGVGAGTEVEPEVLAASASDAKLGPKAETTADANTEAAAVSQANDKTATATATEPATESDRSGSEGLFSFYTSFWRMVGAWFGGTKPKD